MWYSAEGYLPILYKRVIAIDKTIPDSHQYYGYFHHNQQPVSFQLSGEYVEQQLNITHWREIE